MEFASSKTFRHTKENHFVTADIDDSIKRKRISVSPRNAYGVLPNRITPPANESELFFTNINILCPVQYYPNELLLLLLFVINCSLFSSANVYSRDKKQDHHHNGDRAARRPHIGFCARSAFTHLGRLRKLCDCSGHHFTTSQCIIKCALLKFSSSSNRSAEI